MVVPGSALEDIYDEWNGGAKAANALRSFLNWTRTGWANAPKYVLLLGDASYDPRNFLGYGDTDLLPTVYVDTADFETSSDESLVDFDGDDVGEMSIGRLPARTPAQAMAMVNRSLNYQPFNGGAVFVADKRDGYDFEGLNQEVSGLLPAGMSSTFINRRALGDVETRRQTILAVNAGPSVVQYAGHGSIEVWTGAPLFNLSDALNLNNGNRLPVFVTMTCLNGYFHDLNSESLAEGLLKAPNGGALAVFASSSLTMPQGQAAMDRSLFANLYQGNGPVRLGDAARSSKRQSNDTIVRQTWILFGDPTTRLR